MASTNPISNRISLNIPPEDLKAMQDAQQTLLTLCEKHLVALNGDDIRSLGKARDRAWLVDTYQAGQANDDFVPKFVDMEELGRDVYGGVTLAPLRQGALQTYHLLAGTEILCNAEAYAGCLAIYEAVKAAARRNVAGAAPVAERLGRIFALPSRKAAPADESQG